MSIQPKGLNDPGAAFSNIVDLIIKLITLLIPVVASLAFLAFVWGLAKFIMNISGDEKAVGEGKELMKWGLIALFVMISIWGIIRYLSFELGFGNVGLPFLPTR